MEDVQGGGFGLLNIFWVGAIRSHIIITRQWWVLIIALLKNRVYVKHHKVFGEHPLLQGV